MEAKPSAERETLLTPGEVAKMFGVSTTTVTRWARAGRAPSLLTPGGQRRFPAIRMRELRQQDMSGTLKDT
ncbi:helix-turn-helix domain-containing protein [Actinomadura sp. SCN-SB]|uniref:helix-turn-helix domain-containing protein n=1 Tax=Actinomadura sp. SCN-SB TaxID=3373092 RepID=UPI003751B364